MKNLLENFLTTNYNFFNYLILDKRALALFRIVLGLSFLYTILFVKWNFIFSLLGEDALLPFKFLNSISGGKDYSIFLWSFCRTDIFLTIYMWCFLVAAILFTIGFYPRIMAFVLFALQFNITQGANAIATGIDYFSLHLIIWCVFLPINEYYSVFKSKKKQIPSLSICIILLVQIGCVYLFSFLFKYGIPWKEGFAAKLMLMDTMNAWGLASFFRSHRLLYEFITYSTLLVEGLIILLIFIKWKWRKFRMIAAGLVFCFHTLILLSSDVMGFSFVGWSVAVLLVPVFLWKKNPISEKHKVDVLYVKGRVKTAYLVFAFIGSVIIIQRNFYTLYKSYNDTTTLANLDKLMIPSPAKSSISHQYWSMFAPNPPKHLGSFGIVKTNSKIDEGSIEGEFIYNSLDRKWNNWESQVLYLLRQNIVQLNSRSKGKNLFSFWLEWKIKESVSFNGNYKDYLLVEYRYLVSFDSANDNIETDTLYYSATEILKGNFKPIK